MPALSPLPHLPTDAVASPCPCLPYERYVGRGTRIESSLLLGNGAWLSDSQRSEAIEDGQRVYGVGESCCLVFCMLGLVGCSVSAECGHVHWCSPAIACAVHKPR